MATNTVEATLRSHYSDGVSRAVETTRRTLEQNMAMMRNAGVAMSRGIGAAFEYLASKAEYWSRLASQVSGSTDDSFKRMIMSSRLWSMGIVAALGAVIAKITEFVISAAKEASDLTELKIVYEGLTRTVGWHADTLARVKSATEGLVGSTDLLKNSNRVMQSGIKISGAQYIQLTENVFRLAKAARVDGAQALNMLTDALIKGNARGFQAIGIHINVKDAISEMAMATGQHTTALQDSARMQAFYNELLQKTGEAAAKLPADFLSFRDALTRLEKI